MSSNGLKTGNYTQLNVLKDGVMTDVTTLVGGGGTVETATYPLVITGSNIGINTSLFLPTSSECANIGAADCDHGANDFQCQTLTLTSPDASEHELSVDNTGRLSVAGAKPLLANSLTVGSGLFSLASQADGLLQLALTGAESRTSLRLQDGAAVVRELTSSNTGQLTWDGNPIESLAGLAVISPIALASNVFDNSWMNIAGASGFTSHWTVPSGQSYGQVTFQAPDYVRTNGVPVVAGGTLTFSLQAMLVAGGATNNSIYMAVGPSVVAQVSLPNSTLNNWVTLSVSYTAPSAQNVHLFCGGGIAYYTPTVPTQTAGVVRFQNVNVSMSGSRLEYSGGDFKVLADVIANSFISSSDRALKENIENVDTSASMSMLEAVSARTYQRTDLENSNSRIGFIAQEVQALAPPEWGNLVQSQNGLLALDYSRFVSILWTICKNQEARIKALEDA